MASPYLRFDQILFRLPEPPRSDEVERKVYWDPVAERVKNDDHVNAMLSHPNLVPTQSHRCRAREGFYV